jgi:hypothetical protein
VHAVVVKVTRGDAEKAQEGLRRDVVPRVSKAPGFIAGYWTASGSSGLSMIVFESEENARRAAEMIRENAAPETVTIEEVEVREVVASA